MCDALDRGIRIPGLLLIGIMLVAAGCQQGPVETATTQTTASPVERGKYLVTVVACGDCHTPHTLGPDGPEPDMAKMLSGHPESSALPPPPRFSGDGWIWGGDGSLTAYAGPWGVTYAANLTPDENTGIGIWDEQMFIDTLRNGRHMANGRPLLPPMPWQAFKEMTDDDLKAVYAYLRSIPAVSNRVPDPVPPPEPSR